MKNKHVSHVEVVVTFTIVALATLAAAAWFLSFISQS